MPLLATATPIAGASLAPAGVVDTVVTVGDTTATVRTTTTSLLGPQYQLGLGSPGYWLSQEVEALTPLVATADAAGVVAWRAPGTAMFRVRGRSPEAHRAAQLLNCPMDPVGGISTNTQLFQAHVAGSLAEHANAQIAALLSGKTPLTAWPVYSVQNHAAGTYVRNTGCWAHGLAGITGVSPWNSYDAQLRAGTLVTPQDILFAAHYEIPVGAQVRFVAADNTVHTRTVTATKRHPAYFPYQPDLTLGHLDSALPGAIAPVKLLPADWAAKLPCVAVGYPGTTRSWVGNQVAALCLDQEEKALVSCLYQSTYTAAWSSTRVDFIRGSAPAFSEWHEEKIVGDSGNPAFLVVNGELVLVTVWTFGGGGGGTLVADQITALNGMLTALGSAYTVTPADLSGFPNY